MQVPKETSKLVAGVRVLHDDLPTVVKPVIAAIDAISHAVLDAIRDNVEWRAARRRSVVRGAGSGGSVRQLDQVPGFHGLSDAEGEGAAAEGVFTSSHDGSAVGAGVSAVAAAALHAESPSEAAAVADMSPRFYATVSKLVRINHSLLNGLGVGHEALDHVVALSAAQGFVAKLTGAGGGGCALTLLPPSCLPDYDEARVRDGLAAVVAACEALGYESFRTQLGGDGVLVRR